LGIAISEAVEAAATSGGTKKYSLGSVLNHVLLHQTVVGQETLDQLEMAGEYPDFLIACTGGGSNFGGFAFPFLHQNFTNGKDTTVIAAEPAASPTLTRGKYTFDYGDTAKMAPIIKMHTLGHDFVPPSIHAGGLRYHGMSPQVSALVNHGYVEARSVHQLATFEAAKTFTRAEGIIPAPETTHAIAVAIDEALKCKKSGEEKVIVFNFSGHGYFDMTAYDAYLKGDLRDYDYPAQAIKEAMQKLPQID
jgi:tryptophan synthase beta chain